MKTKTISFLITVSKVALISHAEEEKKERKSNTSKKREK